jgi:PadR family transcriptional regulator PadR
MKNAGWLSYRWEESKSGPPRKYYQITPAGDAFLAQLERDWTAFTQAVDAL